MVGRIRVSFCGSVDAIDDVLVSLFPVAGRPVVGQEFVCRMQMSRMTATPSSRRSRRILTRLSGLTPMRTVLGTMMAMMV